MASVPLLSELALCRLCADAYSVRASYDKKDVHATISMISGVNVIAFRGSNDCAAWWRDFFVLGRATWGHPLLGPVHAGMYGDVLQVVDAIDSDVGDAPCAATGHSKGGGEAQIFAAVRLTRKRAVAQLTTFGAPRVGHLGGWLLDVPGADYAIAGDPVPDEPPVFSHPRSVTRVTANVQAHSGLLAKHFIRAYLEAMGGAPS